jgi:hypothetical protein
MPFISLTFTVCVQEYQKKAGIAFQEKIEKLEQDLNSLLKKIKI